MHNLYLGLGSNLGDRHDNIRRAMQLLDERVGSVYRVSTLIETEPWGYESQHRYVNAVCLLHTMLSPEDCLRETIAIERQLGRTDKTEHDEYHDRTIDIDLLTYDDLSLDCSVMVDGVEHRLTLPHPRMQERDFVMRPLAEIQG